MSFGFSIGDFIAVGDLAWQVCVRYKRASNCRMGFSCAGLGHLKDYANNTANDLTIIRSIAVASPPSSNTETFLARSARSISF
jgi:hypothetical protein